MHLQCLSISFQSASLDVREQLSLARHDLSSVLESMLDVDGVEEAFALSTCNRTELYAVVAAGAKPDLAAVLAEQCGVMVGQVHRHERIKWDEDAVRHVFSMVCGMESLALGETEILGQVKQAYAEAVANDSTGKVMNGLFQRAFAVAKHIRTGTEIGRFRVSVASIAVAEIQRWMDDFATARVAVWGTGPVGRAVVEGLAKVGVRGGIVLGRNVHRARMLARVWEGEARFVDSVPEALANCDVFVCCTGAPHAVLHENDLKERPTESPLLLVDLAVPRDVDPVVARLPGVKMIDMDAIAEIQQAGMDARTRACEMIRPILESEARHYWQCLDAARSQRCLAHWRSAVQESLEIELQRLETEFSDLPQEQRQRLRVMGGQLLKGLLAWPMKAMACAMRDGLPCGDVFPEFESELAGQSSGKDGAE